MYFELVQTNKELFSANFDIWTSYGVVGTVTLQGSLGSIDGEITIKHCGNIITLLPGLNGNSALVKNPFRPYRVSINGEYKGLVYQTQYKSGLFQKYDYHQAELSGTVYKMFPIGFGVEGAKNPIYHNNTQISLVEKDCEIVDDLHVYKMTCADDWAAVLSLVFSSYMYVNACYKSGVVATKSVHKVISKTTNKLLIEKYDPMFKELHID